MKRLVRPSICTSLSCGAPPRPHCRDCSHAIYEGRASVRGRVYRWEHTPRWGPLFSRKLTGECEWLPGARHPVWTAYERWHDRKFGAAKREV
jgi:hypothetical protein